MQTTHGTFAPRLVTTGGNNSPQIAHIDWLAFTVKFTDIKNLTWLVQELRQFLPFLTLASTGKGWCGFKERLNISHADFRSVDLGLVAHGGKNQRDKCSIQLNGQACSLINDWQGLKNWCELHANKITRLDLAHDDFKGKNVSIDIAKQWHQAGLFSNNGGRNGNTAVKAKLIDDLEFGDGKTFYVGRRGSGKMLRIYEKGKQLGDKLSLWVRAELELKDKDRIIPWDALVNPSHYLAAAYPCLNYLSTIQSKIKTIKKSVDISINRSVHHLRNMGGKLINLMMRQHMGDAHKVIEILRREGIPRKLDKYSPHLPEYFGEVNP